jgi:hypothetical protein
MPRRDRFCPNHELKEVTENCSVCVKETYVVSFGIKKKQKKIDLTAFVALMSRQLDRHEQKFGNGLSKGDDPKGGDTCYRKGVWRA